MGHRESRNKREKVFFFFFLSHCPVLLESNSFISLYVIGSWALLFGIDLKWNEIQFKLFFDTADPWKWNSAD